VSNRDRAALRRPAALRCVPLSGGRAAASWPRPGGPPGLVILDDRFRRVLRATRARGLQGKERACVLGVRRSILAANTTMEHINEPSIRTTVVDPEDNVTYHIMAYRELSAAEGVREVKLFLRDTKPRNKPKAGSTVWIRTLIGMLQGP
jgi:hypothetical protein